MTTIHMDPRLRARRVEVLRLRGRRRLRWLVFAAAVAALVVATWWALTRSPLFDVDELVVQGAERTSVEAVVEASKVNLGEPLVEVDVSEARAAIAALPWVLDVSSGRSFGGRVTFAISEREPVGAVATADGWLVVDREGRVLEAVGELPTDLVLIEGTRASGEPGGWLNESALGALDVGALLPVGLAPKVAAIAPSDLGGLQLDLFGGGRVLLGDGSELEAKFLAALTLLVRVNIGCLDAIDVRAPAVPVLTRLADCP